MAPTTDPTPPSNVSRNATLATSKPTRNWTVLERIIFSIGRAILEVISFAVGHVALNEITRYDELLVAAQGSLVLGFILAESLLPILLPILLPTHRHSRTKEGNSKRSKCPLCLLTASFCRLYLDDDIASDALFVIVLTGLVFFPSAGLLGYLMLRVWYVLFVPNFHGVPMEDAVAGPWGCSILSGILGYVVLLLVAMVTFGVYALWRLWLRWQDVLVKDIDAA